MNLKEGLKSILGVVREKPEMLISGDPNLFSNCVSFIEGLFCGLHLTENINLEREISEWYQESVTIKAPNMNWFSQFALINKDLPENKKIELLLESIEGFLKEKYPN